MTTAPPTSFEPQPGEVIDGKYRCERVIGEGGMGAVVLATHLLRQAQVALKFMSGSAAARPELVERFINEAVAASRIDSDHVVKIFDVSRLPDGIPYLVMEYLAGEELGRLLAREGAPGLESVPRCIHFTLQVLRALQVAHAAGIVHRDMKPANCFVVTRDGEPDFIKVIDFGISKMSQPTDGVRLTRTHAMLGTPLYMAPEQVRSARRADHRTDLYAAGLIVYELLSGRTPFHAEDNGLAGLFAEVLLGDPAPLGSLRAGLPEGLVTAVHKALTRDPAGRFDSALDMAEALAPYADARSDEVLRGMRRRAGRGVNSSLRPPPGVELPAIPLAPPVPAIASSAAASTGVRTGTVAEEPLLPAAAPPPPSVAAASAPDPAASAVVDDRQAMDPLAPPVARTAMGDSAAAVSATAVGPSAAPRSKWLWLGGVALAGVLVAVAYGLSTGGSADDAAPAGAVDAAGGHSSAGVPSAVEPPSTSGNAEDAGAPPPGSVAPANPSGAPSPPRGALSASASPTGKSPATAAPTSTAPATATPSTTAAPTTTAPPPPTAQPLGDITIQH